MVGYLCHGHNNFGLLGWSKHYDPSCISNPKVAKKIGTRGIVCDGHTGFREIVHKFTLFNNFKVPLQVKQIRVESKKFQILNAETFEGLKWQAGQHSPKLKLRYRTNHSGGTLTTSMMYLETNISTIGIPVNVYHGQLNVSYSVLADDALFGRQTQFSSNSKHINCFRDSTADYDVCLDESDHAHVEEEVVANLGTFAQNSSRFTLITTQSVAILTILSRTMRIWTCTLAHDTVSIATAGGADGDLTGGSNLALPRATGLVHSDDEVLFSRPEYSGSDDDGGKIEDVRAAKDSPYVPP